MSINFDWKPQHKEVILNFLSHLNEATDNFVLKGGTALMTCYGLDRFSEDIDLDGKDSTIGKIVFDFTQKHKISYRIAKDTDTVKRYMIHYGDIKHPLKVETSFRRKDIRENEVTKINGITVYKIDSLCSMKSLAYAGRDKIRDLYDLSFICNNYWEHLSEQVKDTARTSIEYKGIEQFDYLIKTQKDDLIDNNKLAEDFLKMYDKLGLLADENEKKLVNETTEFFDSTKKMTMGEKITAAKERSIIENSNHTTEKSQNNGEHDR